ncbi:hypothetical protein [Aeromicrobium sp.]|uniref:hypothetical protein n=1 Tax=Aeromicrobium sp. TaxID=1871063 RepID=UPI00198BEFF7|nr:hypothetical protein [Aeromicrobium sp.]MBC7631262.1 hypothetical protein [Aeromicrobium sp.]
MNTYRSSRRRRRQAAAVITLASALLLAGCGASGSEDTSAGSAPSQTPTTTAAAVAPDGTDTTLGSDGGRVLPQENVFSVLSPWNTTANDQPVDPQSADLMELAKERVGRNDNGQPETTTVDEGIYINTRAWTGPVVADGTPTVIHCRQIQCGDGAADITLNIPDDISPNPIYDGWYTVFDTGTQKAYDLWRARREANGVVSYQFMRQWDLDGPGFNQPYVVSARGSGLPLFGGLIRPGELERGEINHALAISVPGAAAGNFVQPASSTDGNGLTNSLPEGARIFLKDSFRLTRPLDPVTSKPLKMSAKQYRYARYLVETLKTYGAIVVDRAAVPTLYFERIEDDVTNPLIRGYELQSIGLEDFSVVDFTLSDRISYPPEDEFVDPTLLDGSTGVLQQDSATNPTGAN